MKGWLTAYFDPKKGTVVLHATDAKGAIDDARRRRVELSFEALAEPNLFWVMDYCSHEGELVKEEPVSKRARDIAARIVRHNTKESAMREYETPDNKVLKALFGPTISIKEIIITIAALIIIGGALGIL